VVLGSSLLPPAFPAPPAISMEVLSTEHLDTMGSKLEMHTKAVEPDPFPKADILGRVRTWKKQQL